jgi:hypothetical protein
MKGFETYLQMCIRPEWSGQYMDYGLLKNELRYFYSRRHKLNHASSRDGSVSVNEFMDLSGIDDLDDIMPKGYFQCVGGAALTCVDGCSERLLSNERIGSEKARRVLSTLERKDFTFLLEKHAKRAGVFYAKTLLQQVERHIENQEYVEASQVLLETLAFACTTVVTFRQLLIRYDAFCKTFEGFPLSEAYLQETVIDVYGIFGLEKADTLEEQITLGLQMNVYEVERGHDNEFAAGSLAEQVKKFHALLMITDEKASAMPGELYNFGVLLVNVQKSELIDDTHCVEQFVATFYLM